MSKAPLPVRLVLPHPSAHSMREAKVAAVRQWSALYGDAPYEVYADRSFSAIEGCEVARVVCRSAIPQTMTWRE